MTTFGKLFIGATIAQTAYSLLQQNVPASQQKQKPTTIAEGISYIMAEIDKYPEVKVKYLALNDAEKMYFIKSQLDGLGIKI